MRNYLRNFFDNWHGRRHHKVHRQIKDRLFRFFLEEYAKFVSITRQFASDATDRKAALNDAILYCIQNHILEEFLRKYRTEVLGMLLEEFDVNKYERSLREEGETRLATLLNHLFSDDRMEDAKLVLTDKALREKLYREYGIK